MIVVFRLSHRLPRDERITTHVALVARAFGADGMNYSGQRDAGLESSVSRLAQRWGGDFFIEYKEKYLNAIKGYKEKGFTIVHLTMYGVPLPEAFQNIEKAENLLIIVGSERVPKEIYDVSDFNIAITSQPHSEVAALAIFLEKLKSGKQLERDFDKRFGGRLRIKPSERGKVIEGGLP
ncbi:MAG: tRNA (cytidine(56)-2'-O)-methyltransferase [Candidatus Bilamarchaeaceae archaeon]